METWELWFPDAAATGLPFARGRLDPTDVVWVHAAPAALAVVVRGEDERVVARADRLERRGERFPMTRLERRGGRLSREDRFPTEDDLGGRVILPGGEVGALVSWWNAADGSEWRWRLELYNRA
ncbi:MAG TPA: hypothetical protein VFC93_13680 [Chloroflexota bacterium]|nr:hypothetical protein [Chloroflexota bacterium]